MQSTEKYLDPPDEPEAEYCDTCNIEMVIHPGLTKSIAYEYRCDNTFCPDKFIKGTVQYQMAVDIVEKEIVLEQFGKLLRARDKEVANFYTVGSQPQPALRETSYQVKRMSDAIELAYLDEGMSAEGRRLIWLEWAECKKIMENL